MSNTFDFTHDGKPYSIPAFKTLPIGVVRKARKGKDDADITFIILETVMPEGSKELDAIDAMSQEEFAKFITEWTQGAGVGEA